MLKTACQEAAGWPDTIKVAVNLSPLQFRSGSLVLHVTSALAATRLRADRLEVEITEGLLLQDTEATLATLHQLRDLGVRISMDDFGTGYSSLSYLRKFPFVDHRGGRRDGRTARLPPTGGLRRGTGLPHQPSPPGGRRRRDAFHPAAEQQEDRVKLPYRT